jgi:hypothetical protein
VFGLGFVSIRKHGRCCQRIGQLPKIPDRLKGVPWFGWPLALLSLSQIFAVWSWRWTALEQAEKLRNGRGQRGKVTAEVENKERKMGLSSAQWEQTAAAAALQLSALS